MYAHCNLVNVNSNIVKRSKGLQLNRKMEHASKWPHLYVGWNGGGNARCGFNGGKKTDNKRMYWALILLNDLYLTIDHYLHICIELKLDWISHTNWCIHMSTHGHGQWAMDMHIMIKNIQSWNEGWAFAVLEWDCENDILLFSGGDCFICTRY